MEPPTPLIITMTSRTRTRPTESTDRWILLNWRSGVVYKSNGVAMEGVALRNISKKSTMPIPAMKVSFESVCDFVSRKAYRNLAYGLVKNTLYFFTGPTGSATRLYIDFFNTPFIHLF